MIETPRQQTFSAIQQGRISPVTRTRTYRHEHVLYHTYTDRAEQVRLALLPFTGKLGGKQSMNGSR